MHRGFAVFFAALGLLVQNAPARALCSGATVRQEFKEADLVIRARLSSELNIWNDEPSKAYARRWGDGESVVLYGLHVEDTFKGPLSTKVNFFEERNSGAFYLDADKDYLLFLNRVPKNFSSPIAGRGAFYIRYACGQSKEFSQVKPSDFAELKSLSGGQ